MHAVRVAPVVAVVLGLLVMSGAAGCDAISGHRSAAPVASQLSTSAAVVSRPAIRRRPSRASRRAELRT